MDEKGSRPENETATVTGEVAFSKARASDIPMLPHPFDAKYERELESWASGWQAAAAFYRPRLDNLEAECDRLHLRAYNKPEDVKRILARRVDAGLAEYEWHFMRGEVQ